MELANSRHPHLTLPYADEYRPLLKGVPGYRREFALERYFATGAGIGIDFEDCGVPTHDPAVVALDFAALERDVRQSLLACAADLPALRATARAVGE